MKDKAQEIMKTIEKKLNGQMGKNAHAKLPISTEGQVIIAHLLYFDGDV